MEKSPDVFQELLARKKEFYSRMRTDENYRNTLIENPRQAARDLGVEVPEGVDVKVVMDNENVRYFHIPFAPVEGEITDQDLLLSQGGTTLACSIIAASGVVTAIASATAIVSINEA
ncbi:NHLP leader peptide family RiPP precursor [Ruegeria sp. 2205SS24-7]|uniref:NHLP leader peptide family RiPP precursor n=1 Tax=Ruegeria discodermiae TaxID=3064389 RepID=UPI002741FEBA|nr:NHLP leader peptide family RiPP precursor [Ruegeria sp. 2205SS24-7]MDP5220923.1 NHLP leader peptide family RiPP precursor [Ruegeria sp. 2205SS24-7]